MPIKKLKVGIGIGIVATIMVCVMIGLGSTFSSNSTTLTFDRYDNGANVVATTQNLWSGSQIVIARDNQGIGTHVLGCFEGNGEPVLAFPVPGDSFGTSIKVVWYIRAPVSWTLKFMTTSGVFARITNDPGFIAETGYMTPRLVDNKWDASVVTGTLVELTISAVNATHHVATFTTPTTSKTFAYPNACTVNQVTGIRFTGSGMPYMQVISITTSWKSGIDV